MRYRTIIKTRRKILGLLPKQWWVSIGASLLIIGIVIGIVTVWPGKSSQAGRGSMYQKIRNIEDDTNLVSRWHDSWTSLPGTQMTDDGLLVKAVPFRIVEQDGSGGQSNPPVNLYGAHLKVAGDFKLRAELRDIANGGKASLSLYGQVPIIYDEFRFERATLRLTLSSNQLGVQTWEDNKTSDVKTFAIKSTDEGEAKNNGGDLEITRQDGLVHFVLDDTKLGDIPEGALFKNGEVWFGADAEGADWRLASLRAERLHNADLQVVDTSSLTIRRPYGNDRHGLQQLAEQKRRGFTIGAAVALAPLVSDSDYARIALGGNFGSFTTENALKWQFVHPTPNTYDFHEADAIVELAERHDIAVHGHTLVFGEANPQWVNDLPITTAEDRQKVEYVMTDYIAKLIGRYASKINSWDVVNEPLADYDDFESGRGTMRRHIWYRALGENYIAKAFHAARKADPHARLFINEFGLEENGERWDAFYSLVARLKKQGVPIDGVGLQAHVYENTDKISVDTLREHIRALAKLGLDSRISEMDVYVEDGRSVQAQQYSSVLQACLEEPSCVSFTTWGISDRYNMFQEDGNLQYGQDFLWDAAMHPTAAVDAMRQILE